MKKEEIVARYTEKLHIYYVEVYTSHRLADKLKRLHKRQLISGRERVTHIPRLEGELIALSKVLERDWQHDLYEMSEIC